MDGILEMIYRLKLFLRYDVPWIKRFLDRFERRRYYRDNMKDPGGRASLEVFDMIPREQIRQVFKGTASAEIEPAHLGNVLTYKNLAELIPEEWTVVDLGCSYNAQSYLFQNHLRHIAVDYHHDYNEPGEDKEYLKSFRFMAPNCELFEMSIQKFIMVHVPWLDLATTFAICSWVPDERAAELVRRTFPNNFTIYPATVKRKCHLCGKNNVDIHKKKGIYYYEPHYKPRSNMERCGEWWKDVVPMEVLR